jgi:CRP/FNR family transcriptional regulator, cyclic AMP receptor protein
MMHQRIMSAKVSTMVKDYARTALERSVLFVGAPEAALKMALEAASVRHFAPDAEIFREDDPGEAIYLITEGRVKVSRANLEGRERIFTILTPPELLGEMSLISSAPRSATAYCLDNVTTVVLYRDELRGILDRYPLILWNLAKILAKRLGDMNREVEMLSFASTQSCVAYALQGLYLRGAFKPGKDGLPTLEFTHQDLANRTGNSRETITRVLKDLEGDAIIKTRPGFISLLKPQALEDVIYGLRDSDE